MFPNKNADELLAIRDAISAALDGGSQTHVGIAPGIAHEFAELKPAQLRRRLEEVDYALYLRDPDKYANPYSSKVMNITTVYPESYGV